MRLHIHTDNPAEFFDVLSSHSRIINQKVEDMKHQYDLVNNRKYKRVILTDSIADLPSDYVDEEQIHIVPLNILFEEETYIDKLTIENEMILKKARISKAHPTSSQPSLKTIDNAYNYLLNYYDEIIVMTVSGALSGTFNAFMKVASDLCELDKRIHIIDTKQNSIAEGLLVWQAQEYLKDDMPTGKLLSAIKKDVKNSKILVQINTLDNMIASGRLSVKAGNIAKKVGLKPIITLDAKGEGAIEKIAFSKNSALNKIVKHLRAIKESKGIKHIGITYIDDYENAIKFKNMIESAIDQPVEFVVKSSSIIALGAGTGAQAVSYIAE